MNNEIFTRCLKLSLTNNDLRDKIDDNFINLVKINAEKDFSSIFKLFLKQLNLSELFVKNNLDNLKNIISLFELNRTIPPFQIKSDIIRTLIILLMIEDEELITCLFSKLSDWSVVDFMKSNLDGEPPYICQNDIENIFIFDNNLAHINN